jgi:hypothetical protein
MQGKKLVILLHFLFSSRQLNNNTTPNPFFSSTLISHAIINLCREPDSESFPIFHFHALFINNNITFNSPKIPTIRLACNEKLTQTNSVLASKKPSLLPFKFQNQTINKQTNTQGIQEFNSFQFVFQEQMGFQVSLGVNCSWL